MIKNSLLQVLKMLLLNATESFYYILKYEKTKRLFDACFKNFALRIN
jgi:hypothetical protein